MGQRAEGAGQSQGQQQQLCRGQGDAGPRPEHLAPIQGLSRPEILRHDTGGVVLIKVQRCKPGKLQNTTAWSSFFIARGRWGGFVLPCSDVGPEGWTSALNLTGKAMAEATGEVTK